MRQRTTSTKLTHRPSAYTTRQRADSIHWLFRTNIPRRRGQSFGSNIHRRNFFGMSEIIGVLTNPAEAVRSLTESRQLLEDARREIKENRERSQLRAKHTFSRLAGFFPRQAEVQAIERALEGEPSFTILFGASSVGKTALLREVLTRQAYHVLHFDLRLPGFADISSLYMSLSQQMELFFQEIGKQIPGYEEFEKEGWSFKHDRLNVEKRMADGAATQTGYVKTSDIARLMELFQSSLLKYWEFEPFKDEQKEKETKEVHGQSSSSSSSDTTHVDQDVPPPKPKRKWGFRRNKNKKANSIENAEEKEPIQPAKKMPVILFDEAHKLPALIQSSEAMKCLLDSMLVLTKQDRLCHVIHATSDPFYQTWLRQLNVMQHCKIITIGDCTKAETLVYYRERLLPRVPERLQAALHFEELFEAFGGKLAHWNDYITDYVNANGRMDIKHSSHFLQAHALLNLHIIHSSQSSSQKSPQVDDSDPIRRPHSSTDAIHPGLGPAGFKIYSPIAHPHGGPSLDCDDRVTAMIAGYYSADFSAMQLLKVMSRLSQPGVTYLPYFLLCRELGVRAVDGLVKARVLDLRWTDLVKTNEDADWVNVGSRIPRSARQSGTVVQGTPEVAESSMAPVSEGGIAMMQGDEDDDDDDVVGPKLVPTTPIVLFAMREVVQEYEDVQSVSEYASLSDVDEY